MNGCIYLIGFMGVGKSHVGRCLSGKLGVRYVDADAEIEKQQGMPISAIFEKQGEEAFRDMETSFLRKMAGAGNAVVSCGGGMVLRPENRALMKESGKTVHLLATPETVYERVKHSTARPLLNGRMNPEAIRALMEERRERYENAADIRVVTDGKKPDEIAEEIQRILFPASQSSGDFA